MMRRQAQQQAMQLNRQAEIDDYNADLALLAAEDEMAKGRSQMLRVESSARKVMGMQRAAIGASGLRMSGSTAEITKNTYEAASAAQAAVADSAVRKAFKYELDAWSNKENAKWSRYGAVEAMTSGAISSRMARAAGNRAALSALVSGGLQMYGPGGWAT